MKKIFLLLLTAYGFQFAVFSQSVGIGTNTPNSTAKLDISSSTQGVLMPRMTTAQRRAIVNPEPGLIVYDTDKQAIYIYTYPAWGKLTLTSDAQLMPLTTHNAPDGQFNDALGRSVAISGDYAIAGAWSDDSAANTNSGSAYIFHRINGSWVQEAKIVASSMASDDNFGYSVAIDGDLVVVGAPGDDFVTVDRGSAYVFVRSGTNWIQQSQLIASDGVAGDGFGRSVGIYTNNIVVGAPFDDNGANANQGSAYVFTYSSFTWSQVKKLTASDGAAQDLFGSSVSINGAFVIAGAPNDDFGADTDQGSAYIFSSASIPAWDQQKIVSSEGPNESGFGFQVSISGDDALVGSFQSAFFFARTVGVWLEKDSQAEFRIGCIQGDYAIISNEGTPFVSGKVRLLKKSVSGSWNTLYDIEDPQPFTSTTGNQFGVSVSIDGFNIMIGASGKNSDKGGVLFLNFE